MMTRESINAHLGRQPFQPFRITLGSGETIDITRRGQAVAMPKELVLAQEDRFRHIDLQNVSKVDEFVAQQG
jgi:hypothetical protein